VEQGGGTVRVKFIGVGEAFDEELSNTSIWVRTSEGGHDSSILFDCGFTAPPAFWKSCPDPNNLDAVWISPLFIASALTAAHHFFRQKVTFS